MQAHPSISDALETETRKCRELLPLPQAEPELVFREREREQNVPLIHARDVALPLRKPSNDALELELRWWRKKANGIFAFARPE